MKRWIPILEIFVFYALVSLLGHARFLTDLSVALQSGNQFDVQQLFFEAPSYLLKSNPHPFWIGILLFPARYGVFAGIFSGLVSAILYMLDVWYFGDRYLFEDVQFFVLPISFILVGLLMGYVVRRNLQKKHELTVLTETQDLRINQLEQDLKAAKLISQNLERRLVSRMTTLATLYRGAQSMESIQPNEVLDSILDFFSRTIEAEQSALYVPHDSGWALHKSHGWTATGNWPTSVTLTQGLIGQCAEHHKILSIRDFLYIPPQQHNSTNSTDALDISQECLIAAPIINASTGKVEAIFTVQQMQLLNLNSATINVLNFLCSWASRSISRAHFFTQMKSKEIIDPELGIYSFNYFDTRFRQEFMKSKKFYLPLSLGLVDLTFKVQMEEQNKKSLFSIISQILQNSCRDIDIVARFPESQTPFICLFSTVNREQAQELRNTIINNFSKLKLHESVEMTIGISSFTPQTQSADDLINEARMALRYVA